MDSGLLDRFYKGECTQEEVQEVLIWFREDKMDQYKEMEMHALWQEAAHWPVETPSHYTSLLFDRIRERIEEPKEEEGDGKIVRLWKEVPLPFWTKVAAVLLLPLCLLGAMMLYASRPLTTTVAYTTVETTPGVKKTIHLPDGSIIKLNADSRVIFAELFDASTREITLQGEAFFDVAKDSLRPFIVHTGDISTQALGTSFNIDYTLHDSTITVSLVTGVVSVKKRDEGQLQQLSRLMPGMQLTYDKASQQHLITSFDRDEIMGWTQRVLQFNRADRDQVVKKLENWYGVKIELDTSGTDLKPWNYTGEYHNESLDKVLEGIGFVEGFTYERTDKKVKIKSNQPK